MRPISLFIISVLLVFGCAEKNNSDALPIEIKGVLAKLETVQTGENVVQVMKRLDLIDVYNQDDSLVFLDAENPMDRWWLFDLGLGDEWLIEVTSVLEYEPGTKFEDLKYPVVEVGISRGSVLAWKSDRGWDHGLTKVFPRWRSGKVVATQEEYENSKESTKEAEHLLSPD